MTMLRSVVLCFALAGPVSAESLCGVTDQDAVLGAIAGSWGLEGSSALETETLSMVEPVVGAAVIGADGQVVSAEVLQGAVVPDIALDDDSPAVEVTESPYDVDQVDDILETVEADWIADAVSATPCGPEGLTQLAYTYAFETEATGRVTLIPYFTDQVLMISEAELKGDWGLAFFVSAVLLTR